MIAFVYETIIYYTILLFRGNIMWHDFNEMFKYEI